MPALTARNRGDVIRVLRSCWPEEPTFVKPRLKACANQNAQDAQPSRGEIREYTKKIPNVGIFGSDNESH
jgi:hypothetical protein